MIPAGGRIGNSFYIAMDSHVEPYLGFTSLCKRKKNDNYINDNDLVKKFQNDSVVPTVIMLN